MFICTPGACTQALPQASGVNLPGSRAWMLQGELRHLLLADFFLNSKSINSFPPLRLRVWLCLTPLQLLLKKKKKYHRLGACKKQASISPALEAGPEARAEAGSVRTCLLAHGRLCSLCPPMEAGLGLPGVSAVRRWSSHPCDLITSRRPPS